MIGPEEFLPSWLLTLFFTLQKKMTLCLIPWQAAAWLQTPVLPLTENAGLMEEHSKPSTRIAFLNADFRDFQGIPAFDENPDNAILMVTYAKLLETSGWKITHLLDCPLSTERFTGNMVNRMQGKRTLGIIRRTLIMGKLNE